MAKVKAVPKKEVCRLKGGTWIELMWRDSPPTVALLLKRPRYAKGDVSLMVYYPDTNRIDHHPVHSQVLKVLGTVAVPACTSDSSIRI